MSSRNERLHLLAYPATSGLLGTAEVYTFPSPAARAWQELLERYHQVTGSEGNLPYAALATALRAAGATWVALHPTSKNKPPRYLVSYQRLKPDDIHDAFTIWEQLILNVPPDQVSFAYSSKLADIVSQIQPDTRDLAAQITRIGAQPDASGWVYDVASWEAARRLAAQPWPFEDHQVTFRADTRGDLLVWNTDLLWSARWSATKPLRYAAMQLRLDMKTLPHMRDPVFALNPSVFRLADRLTNARTAWLAQHSADAPLLVLGLDDSKRRPAGLDRHTRLALAVWSKLRGEQPLLPDNSDLTGEPGRLRAVIPYSIRFPIGRGLGMHTLRELHTHASQVLGIEPVTATKVPGHRFSSRRLQRTQGRDEELLDPQTLPNTIAASGAHQVRILVLYSTTHTRRRIHNLLAYHFGRLDLATTSTNDDEELALRGDTVTAVFHRAPELLEHGSHEHREALVRSLPHVTAPTGTRVVAFCETDYDAAAWAQQRRKARFDPDTLDPDAEDAKHPVNHLLAKRGVPSQFLVQRAPKPAASAASPLATWDDLKSSVQADHPGHSAIGDLLRTAGLVHPRLGEALTSGTHAVPRTYAYVGLHLREQRAGKGANKLAYALAALVPDGKQWKALGYCWNGKTGWRPYAEAQATFRAHPLPTGSRSTAYDSQLPEKLNTALSQLRQHLGDMPYVLFISGDAGRVIWPRLANKHLDKAPDPDGNIDGRLPLPGPREDLPAAVVRVTSGSSNIPRPVRAISEDPEDGSQKTLKTTKAFYQLDTPGPGQAWILSNVPRQFDGNGRHRRLGSQHSRWRATSKEQEAIWYAHTATEILVLDATLDEPLSYAVAAARLCDHAIAWDGRTQHPAPLHLAMQMDNDHPEYRRTIDFDEELPEEEETESDSTSHEESETE